MDVRVSLNTDDNMSVVTGDGQMSFIENDSFYAKAPPLAASTVGRTQSRRFMPTSDMGSFLDDTPVRAPGTVDDNAQLHLSFSTIETGARPKMLPELYSHLGPDCGDRPPGVTSGADWSVVNDWCRANKQDCDMSDQDGKSSLGIINVDDMDLSSNNLLLESPRENLKKRNAQPDASVPCYYANYSQQQSTLKEQMSGDSNPWRTEGLSSLKEQGSADSNPWRTEGLSSLKEQGSADSNPWRTEGSSSLKEQGSADSNPWSSSSNSQDSKPDQPFARSQIGTVKKVISVAVKKDPMASAIRQSLFGQGAIIGEENEDGDASVYNVELEEDDLQQLDADFEEIECSVRGDSDEEKSPDNTPTNKRTTFGIGEEHQLDSIYLRPGTTGEEQTHSKLPYLSKVSLFDGGSGSEIDTEDELEQARKAQGERLEAAGDDSYGHTRPGLEGVSLTDESRQLLPITQRQSAEGNVVTSPIPGDGGGGGDGSSGSNSDDGQGSTDHGDRVRSSYHDNASSQASDQQEQRIRPMGDDLLSDLRFTRFPSPSTGQSDGDLRLSSRYLTPNYQVDDTNQPSFSIDDFLASQNGPLDQDFDPGNRLEASGFNADDASALLEQGTVVNPFEAKSSSFGSFGLAGAEGSGRVPEDSMFSAEILEADWTNDDAPWTELDGSIGTSHGSKTNSLDRQTSLGRRSAASGSPRSSTDQRYQATWSPSSYTGTSPLDQLELPCTQQGTSSLNQLGQALAQQSTSPLPHMHSNCELTDSEIFRKPLLPAPKAANFSKSIAKSKQSLSHSSSSEGSRGSSRSVNSAHSDYVDLEFRTSLTAHAEAQKVGLRRVPSCGGTSEMDLTVNDDQFFGCADGNAMLDADEVQFEEENVFRQDDAMTDTGSPNDSWACRSFMSIARPSWLEDPQEEELVCVRISVGTFMRDRTEALGSLTGEGSQPRPDFGMCVESPPSKRHPARLVEEEEDSVLEATRTSGVGQYGNYTPVRPRANSEKDADITLTMDSLCKTPKAESLLTVSALDIGDLGLKTMNATMATCDSTKLSMGEISMMLKAADTKATQFQNLHASKSKSGLQSSTLASSVAPASTSTVKFTSSNISPTKPSHLPMKKGSSISRNFPKVNDSDKSLVKIETKEGQNKPGQNSADSGYRTSSLGDSVRDFSRTTEQEQKNSFHTNTQNLSPKASSLLSDDVWSSPNTSSYCPSSNGLMDKLDKFKFAESTGNFARDLSEELREKYKIRASSTNIGHAGESMVYDYFARKDREKTPPPDGENHKDGTKSGQIMKGITSQPICKLGDNFQSGYDSSVSISRNEHSITQTMEQLPRYSPVHDKRLLESELEWSRLDSSAIDHGYMPGHHIPDGTEYSQRSDYSHINHRGELREDVAGLDDVRLVESRGFDILKDTVSKSSNNDTENGLQQKFDNQLEANPSVVSGANKRSLISGQARNKHSVNLQPTQSKSPMIKATATGDHDHAISSQTVAQAQCAGADDILRNVETQTNKSTRRLESWTQTSIFVNQNESMQHNNDSLEIGDRTQESVSTSHKQHVDGDKTLNVSNIPPKLPVTSFKHNLLPGNQSNVAEKPHLLTKQSLMKTDFAEDNLRRDYSVRVMDRIYSRNSTGSNHETFQTMNATSSESYLHPAGRDSLESNVDWQYLRGRDTLDTQAGDFPRLSDIHSGYHDYSSFKRLANAQSTPYPHSGPVFGQLYETLACSMYAQTTTQATPSYMQSQLSTGSLSVTDGNLISHLRDRSAAPATLCPVEAPGVLKFKEVCCVGISRKELLPLKNPTDSWMECIIQVKSLEIDGRPARLDNFPFNLRQNKIIIDPKKTEAIHVMFLPKCAGAYVAHVQVFSYSFVKKDDICRDVIPVNVTLQAIAEDPWITVYEKCSEECEKRRVIDYGEIVWGSCEQKTICIRNMGLATVPLRLAITSNKGWHCYSFEPEGRDSDVSVISGRQPPSSHGRSIINLSLPGSDQPFNYHEVMVWCRPPNKQCTKVLSRQAPEIFTCCIDVEVDIPSCKFAKLSSLHLTATVGVQKLHIQANLKEIQLICAPNKTQETNFKVFNAGNLKLDAVFGFSAHKQLFSVSPAALTLEPGIDAELSVAFMPTEECMTRVTALLLMFLQPDGPMFELTMHGEVRHEVKQATKLLCDLTNVNFGGVPIGKTCVKRYRLINKDSRSVKMSCMARADNILLARTADPNTVGSKSLDLYLPAEEVVPVYVLYSPGSTTAASGRVVMKPVTADSTKYTVHIAGYGGVSRLCCSEESTNAASVRGFPCVGIQSFSLGKVKEVFMHNLGARAAHVKVAVYNDLDCKERMLSGQVVVQPSEFVIEKDHRQKLEIVISLTEHEFQVQADCRGVGAALCFAYQDKVDSAKPYKSELVVGLVKGIESMVLDGTSTPSVSSRTMRFTHYTDYNQLTDRSDSLNVTNERCRSDNTQGWCIKPQQLVLYCSSRGPSEELDKFYIHNNRNRDIRFELAWPGKMLSLTPADGLLKARENLCICIIPTSQVSQCLDKLPWSGTVMVTCESLMKSMKVEIRRDFSAENMVPESDDRSLVPISTNIPHPIASTSRLGNMQVSRTVIPFDHTRPDKISEEMLELSNLSNEMFRWRFTSFASPYLRKSGDGGKDMFRVSYKVFDFSRQFGKLAAKATIQLTLQFMPRSTGTFSQYWDLQTTGSSKESSSSKQEFIRIHLTGEGLEETEGRAPVVDTENLLPRLPGDNTRLRLAQEVLKFPAVKPGQSITMKIEIKNSHLEDVQVEVTAPKPPFHMKHPRFKVAKKRYIKLPVEFRPSRTGSFRDIVKFQGSKGESLVLKVVADCH